MWSLFNSFEYIHPSLHRFKRCFSFFPLASSIFFPLKAPSKADAAPAKLKALGVLKVEDAPSSDHSTVSVNPDRLQELGLVTGDTVFLKGKRLKNTIAIVNADDSIKEASISMNKSVRKCLR